MDEFITKDGVESLCKHLHTMELENEEVCLELNLLEEVVSRGKNYILVKLLMKRYYNREAFKTTTRKVWWPAKSPYFHEMGAWLMLTEFENQNDKIKASWDGPWHFDKCVILVKDFDGTQ